MEEKIHVEHLISDVKEYAEERLNLIILNAQEKTSKAVANIASILLVAVLALFMLGFISTAVAWFIGQLLEQPFVGFIIVGGVYLLAAIILWANREKWIGLFVMNAFLKNISDDED